MLQDAGSSTFSLSRRQFFVAFSAAVAAAKLQSANAQTPTAETDADAVAGTHAALSGLYQGPEDGFADLLGRLKARGLICGEANELFHSLRKAGNLAAHADMVAERISLRVYGRHSMPWSDRAAHLTVPPT